MLLFSRRADEAVSLTQKALELERNYAFGLTSQGLAFTEQGRMQEAIGNLQKAAQLDRSPTILALGAHVHAVAGQKSRGQETDPGGRGRVQAPLFLPVTNRHRVCEPWESRYRLSVVPQRHRGSRRLLMAWLGSNPGCGRYRASDARYAQLLREIGDYALRDKTSASVSACWATSTEEVGGLQRSTDIRKEFLGLRADVHARFVCLSRALAGIDEEDRRTRPRGG